MTTATGQAEQRAAANGQGPAAEPAAADGPCEECATGAEKLMGVVGLAFAIGLAVIAVDLLSGGALTRGLAGLFGRGGQEGGDGGQPGAA